MYVLKGVEVRFYRVQLSIFDVNVALGYIFSACLLPLNATAIDTYIPLLAMYYIYDAIKSGPVKSTPAS